MNKLTIKKKKFKVQKFLKAISKKLNFLKNVAQLEEDTTNVQIKGSILSVQSLNTFLWKLVIFVIPGNQDSI